MSSVPPPPRLGPRVPLPPPPRIGGEGHASDGLLKAGDLLEGRYQIEDRIGEGGIGVVYRALQLKLHRRVAIKVLQHETIGEEDLRGRFEREAVALAALAHPNIVSLTDYGVVRGRPFLVMELLEGRTLRELLDREGALTVDRALALARQLVLGLAYAHGKGIVHRDLKPANIVVQTLPNQPEHLKILDFGLVKFLPGSHLDPGVQLSRVGFTFGTPAYMSPEHASGGPVDGRADLYSVGILLFEMLTGTKPFDGELDEILRAHFSAPVPLLGERLPALASRSDLDAFLSRSLAKDREDRIASAGEMLAALDALAPSTAPSGTTPGSGFAQAELPAVGASSISPDEVPGMRQSLSLRAAAGQKLAREGLGRAWAFTRRTAHRAGQRMWAVLQPFLVQLAEGTARSALRAKAWLDTRPPALRPDGRPGLTEAPTLPPDDGPGGS